MADRIENLVDLLLEMANPAMVHDNEVVSFEKRLKTGKSDVNALKAQVETLYNNYKDALATIRKKFETLIRRDLPRGNDVKFISDTKTIASVIDKAISRKKGFMSINDLVRGAVLFRQQSDMDDFVKRFTRKNASILVEAEHKARGGDATYGYYGSHHFSLNIDGIIVELQVMTQKLWAYKHAAHQIYTSTRSKAEGPSKQDKHLSKELFSRGNKPAYVKEDIEVDISERELMEMFTLDELSEMDYTVWVEVAV